MSNRAKRTTLVLNLFAIALVGLLYNQDRADDHSEDQQVNQEMTTSGLTSPHGATKPLLLDAGIKMVDVNLPPPPAQIAQMTSTEAKAGESVLPMVKQNVEMLSKSPSKQALTPMKKSISTPQFSPNLETLLAKNESVVLSPKTPNLQPLSAKKLPLQAETSSNSDGVKFASLVPLGKTVVGHKQMKSVQSIKTPVITPMRSKSLANARPTEINIQQANLLRGQHTLNTLAGEGGFDMEIFWPPTAQQSEYLYTIMTQCFGMQSAVIDSNGNLFLTNGKDRESRAVFSPFLRKIMQPASRDELRVIDEIVKRNAIGAGYTPVRIFSQFVDARLVDGVAQLTSKVIHARSELRANYVIDRGRVYITNITHDGILSSGRVLLADGRC